jgi:hypothetical protein
LRCYVHGNDLISTTTGGSDYFFHYDRIASEVRIEAQRIVVRTILGRKVSFLYPEITGIRTYRAMRLGERTLGSFSGLDRQYLAGIAQETLVALRARTGEFWGTLRLNRGPGQPEFDFSEWSSWRPWRRTTPEVCAVAYSSLRQRTPIFRTPPVWWSRRLRRDRVSQRRSGALDAVLPRPQIASWAPPTPRTATGWPKTSG